MACRDHQARSSSVMIGGKVEQGSGAGADVREMYPR